jgi:3-oxoacyl-[acyl-carrier protein] reductase
MELGLDGRSVIVLGGTAGIGLACAVRFAREGAKVAICGRDANRLEAARAHLACIGGKVLAAQADVSDEASLTGFVAKVSATFGATHVLVNNAAGPKPGKFEALTDEDWQYAFETTLMSAIRASRAVLPAMRAQRWGRIVNVSSYGVRQPIAGLMLSNGIRLGAVGWAKTLAGEVAAEGITVNTVCPGWTETDRLRQVVDARAKAAGKESDVVAVDIARSIPAGRFGTPEEIADVIVFLASERASYLTGAAIQVDGGIVQAPL